MSMLFKCASAGTLPRDGAYAHTTELGGEWNADGPPHPIDNAEFTNADTEGGEPAFQVATGVRAWAIAYSMSPSAAYSVFRAWSSALRLSSPDVTEESSAPLTAPITNMNTIARMRAAPRSSRWMRARSRFTGFSRRSRGFSTG